MIHIIYGLYLYSAFLVFFEHSKCFTLLSHIHTELFYPFQHNLQYVFASDVSHTMTHRRQCGAQYLAQGHLDVRTGEAEIKPPTFWLVGDHCSTT